MSAGAGSSGESMDPLANHQQRRRSQPHSSLLACKDSVPPEGGAGGGNTEQRVNRASFITRLVKAINVEELVHAAEYIDGAEPSNESEKQSINVIQRLIHFVLNDSTHRSSAFKGSLENREEHLLHLMTSVASESGGVGGQPEDRVAEWLVDHFFGEQHHHSESGGVGGPPGQGNTRKPRSSWESSRGEDERKGLPLFRAAASHVMQEIGVTLRLKSLVRGAREERVDFLHIPEVEPFIRDLNTWGFNVWELNKVTGGHPLIWMGYHCFVANGIIDELGLDVPVLLNFLSEIEARYLDVPYHNKVHGACVVQVSNFFLNAGGLGKCLNTVDKLAYLLAAIVHDVGHLGVNNRFLVSAQHDLAVVYNDKSPLENYHLAEAFRVLARPECNVLATLPEQNRLYVRTMLIDCVLNTDMVMHFQLLAEFKDDVEARKTARGQEKQPGPSASSLDVQLAMRLAIHAADLGNVAKPFSLAHQWTERVMQEFYGQGDRERHMGLPISPNCDRENPIPVPKSQLGFIEHIVVPLYESLLVVIPDIEPCMVQLKDNVRTWTEALAKEMATGVQCVPTGPVGGGAGRGVEVPPPLPGLGWGGALAGARGGRRSSAYE